MSQEETISQYTYQNTTTEDSLVDGTYDDYIEMDDYLNNEIPNKLDVTVDSPSAVYLQSASTINSNFEIASQEQFIMPRDNMTAEEALTSYEEAITSNQNTYLTSINNAQTAYYQALQDSNQAGYGTASGTFNTSLTDEEINAATTNYNDSIASAAQQYETDIQSTNMGFTGTESEVQAEIDARNALLADDNNQNINDDDDQNISDIIGNGDDTTASKKAIEDAESSKGLGDLEIAGIIIGAVVASIIIGVLITFCKNQDNKKRKVSDGKIAQEQLEQKKEEKSVIKLNEQTQDSTKVQLGFKGNLENLHKNPKNHEDKDPSDRTLNMSDIDAQVDNNNYQDNVGKRKESQQIQI
jgi:hypothetical protein